MTLLEQIQKQLPQLKGTYSTWSRFWTSFEEIQADKFEWYLHQLYSAAKPLVPIAPGNIIFNITDPICEESLIDQTKDYAVYDVHHNLIYKVADHQGVFGTSTLDKLLVINGKALDIFYLYYYLEDGSKKVNTLFLNKG